MLSESVQGLNQTNDGKENFKLLKLQHEMKAN